MWPGGPVRARAADEPPRRRCGGTRCGHQGLRPHPSSRRGGRARPVMSADRHTEGCARTTPSSPPRPRSRQASRTPRRRRNRPLGAPPPSPRHLGRGPPVPPSADRRRLLATSRLGALLSPSARRSPTRWMPPSCVQHRRAAHLVADDRRPRGRPMTTGGPTVHLRRVCLLTAVAYKRWRHLFTFIGASWCPPRRFRLIVAYHRPRPYDVTIIGRSGRLRAALGARAIVSAPSSASLYIFVVPVRPDGSAKSSAPSSWWRSSVALCTSASTTPSTSSSVRPRSGDPLVALPVLHTQRGRSRHLRRRKDRPPRHRWPARRGAAPRRRGAARRHRRRRPPDRSRRLRRIDAAAAASRRGPGRYVFGKIYTMNHVRADRWYKTGRTILYGRLEDEAPFQTVRRLVAIRGLPVARDRATPVSRRPRRSASSS